MAKSRRDEATMFALNACSRATRAEPRIRLTIHWVRSAFSNATAVGNCRLTFRLCHGDTKATAEITTQKKNSPTKMVRMIATEKFLLRKSGLASSTHFTTDSKPESSQGTTCQTSRMEISGAWLNNGRKFSDEPCFAPA